MMVKLTCSNCYYYYPPESYCEIHKNGVGPDAEPCPEHSGYPWFQPRDPDEQICYTPEGEPLR